MEPNEHGAVLQEAFRMGESKDDSNRKKSIELYQTIVKENPAHFTGWYNLGVIQYRMGEWQEALRSFSEAEKYPELRVAAAYARLKIMTDNGQTITDEDLPEGYRGESRGALGVQGPCHNAANELRNRGYACTIEADGEQCKIISMVGWSKYVITFYDLLGVLFRNVYREENGRHVNLSEPKNVTVLDEDFTRLEIGKLDIAQAPVSGSMAGTAYSDLRKHASGKTGPRGWIRQGESFDESAARQKAEYAGRGITHVIIISSIEDIAKKNCEPGVLFSCVYDGEPTILAMLYETHTEQFPTVKSYTSKGLCKLHGEYFPMPEYPIVHLGLGVPVREVDNSRVEIAILESMVNFAEANFQDWATTMEQKKHTMLHIYAPNGYKIADGRMELSAVTISEIIHVMDEANAAYRKMPETTLNFKKAVAAFCEKHPDPFV